MRYQIVQGTRYEVPSRDGGRSIMLLLDDLGTLYLVLFHFYVIWGFINRSKKNPIGDT